MKFADLHLHTVYSDGSYRPEALVLAAKRVGLAAIALTDHDTFDGIEETLAAGQQHGIEVIPGVEITARLDYEEVHILGYFFGDGWQHPLLCAVLDHAKRQRDQRVVEFAKRFKELDIPLTEQEIRQCSTCGTIGRMHVAQALAKRGVVQSVDEAFQRFLRRGKPGFVDRPRMEVAEAIGHICRAGGMAVMAHPGLNNLDDRINEMKDQGLTGLEVWHSRHTPAQTERYLALAKRLGLVPTGGSDCHGTIRDEALIGRVKVPYDQVLALKAKSP